VKAPGGLRTDLTICEARDLCKSGQGTLTCRYLGKRQSYLRCLKHTARAGSIDSKVARGKMVAAADNCEGRRP
jgi:hypothetical protein